MTATSPHTTPLRSVSRSRPLGIIFLIAIGGMTVFEVVKSLVHPDITLWESHFATIVFSGFAAVVGGLVALNKYEQLQQQLMALIAEQSQTEKQLRQVQEELEKHVVKRTADLVRTNATLQLEVTERIQAEEVARGQTASLIRTLQLLTSSSSVDAVLAHVLTAIAEQLRAFSSALYLYDLDNQHAWVEKVYYDGKVSIPHQEGERLPHTPGLVRIADVPVIQQLLRTRSPIVIEDIPNSTLLTLDLRVQASKSGVKSALVVPLLLEEKLVGSLHVRHREHHIYRPEDISLVVALSHQAVLALQITRLAEHSERAAIVMERNRMAREIHDTLSQGFTGIIVQLEAADDVLEETPEETVTVREHLGRAGALARESLAEARRSVFNLRPQVLEHESLQGAISHTVQALTAGTSVQANFSMTGAVRQLPIEVEEQLLRVSQQALTNVLQHAQAHNIQVELAFAAQQVRLVIKDDGRGLDYASKNGYGFGLTGMRQRAEQIGGHLTVTSLLGRGTTVTMTVPASLQYPVGNSHDHSGEEQSHSHPDR